MSGAQQYKQLKDHSNSAGFIQSMEDHPLTNTRVSPEESLKENINLFKSLFDSSISELRVNICKLREITESVERIHRNTTVGSLSGGVIGVAGGIMTIVGLGLTPFTLGASLLVTGIGAGVAVSGGVTAAASNITDMINQKVSRAEIEKILKTIQDKLSPILENLKQIELILDEIQKNYPTDPSTQKAQIGFGIGRGIGYTAELLRLINVAEVGTVAARVSTTVKAAAAITGVVSSLFLVLDVVFVAKDATELYRIDNDQKDGKGKSGISEFIKGMNDTVNYLTEILDKVQEVRKQFNV